MNEEDLLPLPSDRNASGRSLGDEEMELLERVIRSGELFSVGGAMVPRFEEELSAELGVGHARAVPSGTAAVHTALAALGVGPGDEVVTSPITDMGAVAPVLYQGAVPVFADVDPDTLNVTAETIRPCLSERTRAVVVTHLFGNPCRMEPILELLRGRDVALVEDAAQAYLAAVDGRTVGTIGDMGVFSLQQTKQMTSGEGGAVVTDDPSLARRARVWADKGWAYDADEPGFETLGLNCRMSELQGAVALAQLRKLEGMVAQRIRSAERLRERLDDVPGLSPVPVAESSRATYWKFPLLVDRDELGVGPDRLGEELKDLGVWNAPQYIRKPVFACRPFRERGRPDGALRAYSTYPDPPPPESLESYPGCRDGLARVLVLPWTERHEERHVDYIADQLRRVVARVREGHRATTGGTRT